MGCVFNLWVRFMFCLRDFVDALSGWVQGLIWSKSTPLPPIQEPLLLLPAHTLAEQIRKKQITSEQVVSAYIRRIEQVNPILNAVVETRFVEGLQEAKAADRLVTSGAKTEKQLEDETPFLGVPFTAKENIAAKGMHQTCGIVARKDCIATEDGASIQLMKDAGAILLGTTNLSELCSSWESYNNIYGRTKNPYNTRRIAGGSTGGEGAIISAGGSPFGIGTDIAGSIRKPALFNGIYGLKTSWEIVPNGGIVPEVYDDLQKYLVTGPMCRYASDLIPMLKVLAGPNVKKLKLDEPVDLKKLRIFYMEDDGGNFWISKVDPELKAAQKRVIDHFEKEHGVKAQKVNIEKMKLSLRMCIVMMLGKHRYLISEEMVNRKGKANVYVELIKWMFRFSNHTWSTLLLATAETVRRTCKNEDRTREVHEQCAELETEMLQLLGDDGIFLYPTHPTLAVYHGQTWLQHFNLAYGGVFNVLGFPACACTVGIGEKGLPVGVQVVATHNNDHLCIAVANELEKGFGGWVPPCASNKQS